MGNNPINNISIIIIRILFAVTLFQHKQMIGMLKKDIEIKWDDPTKESFSIIKKSMG
jgi:hypothetical protein